MLSPEEPPPRTRTTTLPLWARETILGAIYSKPEISYYIIRIRVLELCIRRYIICTSERIGMLMAKYCEYVRNGVCDFVISIQQT